MQDAQCADGRDVLVPEGPRRTRSINRILGRTHDRTRKHTLLGARREAKAAISRRDGERGCGRKAPRAWRNEDNHNLSCQMGCVFEIVSCVRAERLCALRRSKPLRGSTRCSMTDRIQSKILVCEVCIHFELCKPICAPTSLLPQGHRLACETKLVLIALAPTRPSALLVPRALARSENIREMELLLRGRHFCL